MRRLSFNLKCVPPKSTAQNRTMYRAGNGKTFFAKNKTAKAAENDLMTLLLPHVPEGSLEGPLGLEIRITWPWRKSEPKKNRVSGTRLHDKKPDLDNWAKTFVDCLTRLNFFGDDSQVSSLHMEKFWGDAPGVEVVIYEFEEVAA